MLHFTSRFGLLLSLASSISACGADTSASGGNGSGQASGGAATGSGGSGTPGPGASGGTPGGVGGADGGGTNGVELLRADFTNATPGPYARADVAADFGAAPPWDNGLATGAERASVVEEDGNRFLRVTYPAGKFGPAEAGVQFKVAFEPHEELFFAYRVRFADGFDFVKGGKLPGLVGGSAPTGCQKEDTGFSARNMWRGGGAAVQYVYYPSQPNNCGDDVAYLSGGDPKMFTPGTWHTVEHRLVMNTPGVADGVLQAWVDTELVVDRHDMTWRGEGASFTIDTLYFSTFFGGGDDSWAPATDEIADFDDLVVATGAISH